MALRAKWTLRLEGVETRLAVGLPESARAQGVQVSLVVNGMTPDTPMEAGDCLDHASICDWIVHQWPKAPPTPLLETRVNELLHFLFSHDKRVQDAWVGVYWKGRPGKDMRVGVERHVNRAQYQARLRMARVRA